MCFYQLYRMYNGVVFRGLLCTYLPKAHPRMASDKRLDNLKQMDYVGAILSIVGLAIFQVHVEYNETKSVLVLTPVASWLCKLVPTATHGPGPTFSASSSSAMP